MPVLSDRIISFLHHLHPDFHLPEGIEVMNPYHSKEVRKLTTAFYQKYYADISPRTLILGINPGRFGAGITGISFTDPIRLEEVCSIPNSFTKRPETSSVFIYEMIEAYGGCDLFYGRYFISAVCPLGFTANGKNLNYYDRKELQLSVTDFIIRTLKEQIAWGLNRNKVYCIGEGKNYQYLKKLNQERSLFREIIPLPHPRFVMQYRFRDKKTYIASYLDALK